MSDIVEKAKTDLRVIQDGLAVLKAAGDQTIKDQAEKIEEAVKNLVEKNRPVVESYAKELKAFDESFADKYGSTLFDVLEFVMILILFVKGVFAL